MKLWTLKYGEALDHESHPCHVESVALNIVLERGSADANEVLDLVFMAKRVDLMQSPHAPFMLYRPSPTLDRAELLL